MGGFPNEEVVSLLLLCFFFDTAYEAAAEGNFPDEIGT
jgi:hypothetical protein